VCSLPEIANKYQIGTGLVRLMNQEPASVAAGGKRGRPQIHQPIDQANLRNRSLLERVKIQLDGAARIKKKIILSVIRTRSVAVFCEVDASIRHSPPITEDAKRSKAAPD
jgi:hypothetical protein